MKHEEIYEKEGEQLEKCRLEIEEHEDIIGEQETKGIKENASILREWNIIVKKDKIRKCKKTEDIKY